MHCFTIHGIQDGLPYHMRVENKVTYTVKVHVAIGDETGSDGRVQNSHKFHGQTLPVVIQHALQLEY